MHSPPPPSEINDWKLSFPSSVRNDGNFKARKGVHNFSYSCFRSLMVRASFLIKSDEILGVDWVNWLVITLMLIYTLEFPVPNFTCLMFALEIDSVSLYGFCLCLSVLELINLLDVCFDHNPILVQIFWLLAVIAT